MKPKCEAITRAGAQCRIDATQGQRCTIHAPAHRQWVERMKAASLVALQKQGSIKTTS